VLLGAGGVVLAAGVVAEVLARVTSHDLDVELQASRAVTPKAVDLAATGTQEERWGWVGVGVGAAGLAAGALVLWLAPEAQVPVAVAPVPGGAVVVWGGRLP
jgi:hypothetical protein